MNPFDTQYNKQLKFVEVIDTRTGQVVDAFDVTDGRFQAQRDAAERCNQLWYAELQRAA